jgi:hypothetical protein
MQGLWVVVSYDYMRVHYRVRDTDLVFLKTVLKYILDDKTSSLAQSNLMPHAAKSFVHIFHDLRWRFGPSEFKELLPDMAGVAMDDCLGDTT